MYRGEAKPTPHRGVLVICGPTATGKTALGVELALLFGGEVVSADAMQVYRGMVIGTAAPTAEECKGVRHHLIGTADPRENYSVSRYVDEASACIDDILHRGKLPILVGGTNLYIDSLLRGIEFSDFDPELRETLEADYARLGGEAMLETLRAFDPERAEKLHPGDRRRIVRAIEIYRLTGKTITQHDAETRALPPRYTALKLALRFRDRADLYARIDRRVDQMVESGLFEEVERLLDEGLSPRCTAM